MRKSIIHILFVFGLVLQPSIAYLQNSIVAEGVVLDLETGGPVPNQPVLIDVSSGGSNLQYEVFTGTMGTFFVDSIPVNGTGLITVQTIDCAGTPHILQDTITPAMTAFWFAFSICTDSLSDCQAFFNYSQQPGPNLAVLFQDLSTGSYDALLWEFGDGVVSSLPDPVHTYNSPGVFIACLSIWDNDSSCFDSYCQDVVVTADTSGCWNFFSYETWNQLDYTFIGESYPLPADAYFWDFGDGNTGSGPTAFHTYDPAGQDTVTVVLTTLLFDPASGDSCVAVSAQTFVVGLPGWECENWFEYTSSDNLTFEFSGSSLPPADGYSWDFGDGQTASGQNVTHTYASGSGGLVPVSLETYVAVPSGDSCFAFSEQWIQVGSNTGCSAAFSYAADSLNSLQHVFTSQSTGPISAYFWDFGDGATSFLENPVHTYELPGTYAVCLTVESDSLGSWCTDTHCDTLVVDFSLEATFTATLDTLSGVAHQFKFYDGSTGNPDAWYWEFGDGTYSYEQHPLHAYDSSGTYQVCLTVSRLLGNTNYEAIHCSELSSPDYFDLGGQVYLDNIPMNNFNGDTTVVDHGIAYLYRKYGNTLVPADTQAFHSLGYYWFSQVRAGDYVVRIRLTETSEHYGSFVPSYYQEAIRWQEAIPIGLVESSSYERSVSLSPLAELPAGAASVSGFVTYAGTANPLMNSLSGVEVILFNELMEAVRFTQTDEGGNFYFEGLPTGSYTLYSEASGLYTVPVPIDINESSAIIEGLQLQLTGQVLDVQDLSSPSVAAGEVYPNPVQEQASIEITLTTSTEAVFRIYDLSGQLLREDAARLPSGTVQYRLGTPGLHRGFYVLTISFTNNNQTISRKFVK